MGKNEKKFHEAFKDSNQKVKNTIEFLNGDISSTKSIEQAFGKIFKSYGKINVLINNAFYSKGQSPTKMTDEDFSFGIDGCLTSVFRCIRSIIPYLRTGDKIINVSSMYAMIAPDFEIYNDSPEFLNPPDYGAAKAGVLQLTKYYASFLGKNGINVNCVTPGPFPPSAVQEDIGFVDKLKKNTLLQRIGRPEDIGGIFTFLSSDAADFITGQNIVIDGGWTIK